MIKKECLDTTYLKLNTFSENIAARLDLVSGTETEGWGFLSVGRLGDVSRTWITRADVIIMFAARDMLLETLVYIIQNTYSHDGDRSTDSRIKRESKENLLEPKLCQRKKGAASARVIVMSQTRVAALVTSCEIGMVGFPSALLHLCDTSKVPREAPWRSW